MSLETRLDRIEARFAIEDAMQDYAAAADAKYTAAREKRNPDAVRACALRQASHFAEDGLWSAGEFGGDLKGRAAIAGFFETSPWLFTSHLYSAARIVVSEDVRSATASWQLVELGVRDMDGRVLLLTGSVSQDWAVTPDGWKIARMGFDRLHAVTLAEAPEAVRCLIPLGEAA